VDPFYGNIQDPLSLHKYLYVQGNPVNMHDPTGQWTLGSTMMTGAIIGAIAGFSYGAYRGFERGVRETGTIWSMHSWAYGIGYGLAGAAVGAVAGAGIAGMAHLAIGYLASLPTAAIPGNVLFDLVGGVHSTVVIAFGAGVVAGLGLGIVAPASTASAIAASVSGGLTAFAGAWDNLLIANKALLPTRLYDWYTLKTLFYRNVNGHFRPVTAHGLVTHIPHRFSTTATKRATATWPDSARNVSRP